ncbi:hypothetical protein [Clostridium sp.]|uniref:hypothetical protein n=1 Tax=Clostridium sp. TaxID=1506 RepID=UPI003F397B27
MKLFLIGLKRYIKNFGKFICYLWLSIYAILSIIMVFMFVTTYINPVQEILAFFGLLSFQIIIPILALTWKYGKKFRIRTLIVFASVFIIGLGLGTQGVSETKDEYYARIESTNREDLTESEKFYADKKN